MKKNAVDIEDIVFSKNGMLEKVRYQDYPGILENGEFFRTSGCTGCNRPFYNEKVTEEWYNFPRRPEQEEIRIELERIRDYFDFS